MNTTHSTAGLVIVITLVCIVFSTSLHAQELTDFTDKVIQRDKDLDGTPKPKKFPVDDYIRGLSSNQFKVREESTRMLVNRPKQSIPALKLAADSRDLEVAFRAIDILSKIYLSSDNESSYLVAKFILEKASKGDNRFELIIFDDAQQQKDESSPITRIHILEDGTVVIDRSKREKRELMKGVSRHTDSNRLEKERSKKLRLALNRMMAAGIAKPEQARFELAELERSKTVRAISESRTESKSESNLSHNPLLKGDTRFLYQPNINRKRDSSDSSLESVIKVIEKGDLEKEKMDRAKQKAIKEMMKRNAKHNGPRGSGGRKVGGSIRGGRER